MFAFRDLHVLSAAAVVAVILFMGSKAWATDRLVPSHYSTIQAAINASVDGDKIIVSPGTYHETITLSRAVTVTGTNPENPSVTLATVISGDTMHPVITVASTGSRALKGLTIQNGSDGVFVGGGGGGTTISKCLIRNNYGNGVNMDLWSGGTTVSFCWITNNYSSGIRAIANTTLTVEAGLIAGNQSGGVSLGSGIYTNVIRDCMIVGNTSLDRGGGIYSRDTKLTISNCTIANNQANVGGGLAFYSSSYSDTITLTQSIVWGNTAATGPAFALEGSTFADPETFTANYSDIQAGSYVGQGNWSWSVAANCFSTIPQFANANGPDGNPSTWADNDYHIQMASPCRNTGNAAFVPVSGETDSDGQPRVLYSRVDVGADEYLIAGDIDLDGAVILADLKLLVAAWNSTPTSPNWNPYADLDRDGAVILADLKILVANWNVHLP